MPACRFRLGIYLFMLLSVVIGCGDDDPAAPVVPPDPPDTTAPADVGDLTILSTTDSSVTLTWTAPGNSGNTGTATEYDIRYSLSVIDDASFLSATQAFNLPAPDTAGTTETFTVTGLTGNREYSFALKAADEASNWSGLSNVLAVATPPRFILQWGSSGSGDGQFVYPQDVALDALGNVYVTDTNNARIQKFDASGNFILEWGSPGAGQGQFEAPRGIAVDSNNDVYVSDSAVSNGVQRVQKFDSNGNFIREWGSAGTGPGQFQFAYDVAVDASDNVYVVDTNNHRVQVFDSDGVFLRQIGSFGTGDGELNTPFRCAVDSQGCLYVADSANNRIQMFDNVGSYVRKWGSQGTGDGQFSSPRGIAVDSNDDVYVCDDLGNRIQKFSGDGAFMVKWGSAGSGSGEFQIPKGIAIDASDNIYVVHRGNNTTCCARVQLFR